MNTATMNTDVIKAIANDIKLLITEIRLALRVTEMKLQWMNEALKKNKT